MTNAPHGGTLISRYNPSLKTSSISKSITLDAIALSDLELIGIGGYSPITGFFNEEDYTSVVEKHKAVELAIDLYDVAARTELTSQKLELERDKLEFEKAKLSAPPTSPFLQQNNVYFSNQPTQEQQQELLERKQAQNAILESFLPKKPQEQASVLDQEDTEE